MGDLSGLIDLLQRLDGHLGLAVHRGEGCSERWLKEADDYISEIRLTIEAAGDVDG